MSSDAVEVGKERLIVDTPHGRIRIDAIEAIMVDAAGNALEDQSGIPEALQHVEELFGLKRI